MKDRIINICHLYCDVDECDVASVARVMVI